MTSIKGDIQLLDRAIKSLDALCDTSDASTCAVADEHKEAVRLYVTTWITPLVQGVRDDLSGEVPLRTWRGWR